MRSKSRKLAPLTAIAAIVLIAGGKAYAGAGGWTSGGPYGGAIRALAVDPATPSTLYAATEEAPGLFKSTDSGTTWASSSTGLETRRAHTLAIDPKQPSTLYAGFDGAFKSTDSGGTWTAIGLTNEALEALAIDPVTPSTLYAGTTGGLFKSTDGGSSWNATGIVAGDVFAVLIDPGAPPRLHVGLANGVATSTDGGQTWTWHRVGSSTSTPFVRALALDPANPAILYAGAGDNERLYKSTDFGATWLPANVGIIGPSGPVWSLAVDPVNPATVYAGTHSAGVFKSSNRGGTWTAMNTGLSEVSIQALSISPAAHGTVYAGARFGVFKTTDAGNTWTPSSTGLTTVTVTSFAVDPAVHGTVYAGTLYSGLFKSIDSGATWTRASFYPAWPNAQYHPQEIMLAIDPSTPSTLYAGADTGLYKSTDAGATWSTASPDLPPHVPISALGIDPETPTTAYVADVWGGVYKSTDSGSTWQTANAGLPAAGYGYGSLRSFAFDGASPGSVYLGTTTGVYKFTDGGGIWTPMNVGLTNLNVTSLAIDPFVPGALYAATFEGQTSGGVFKSTDAGSTWAKTGTNVNPWTLALVADRDRPGILYAGTYGGIFKSSDSGTTWAQVGAGLPRYRTVGVLALDSSGPTLYAGAGDQLGYFIVGAWQATSPPAFSKGDFDGDGQPDVVFRSKVDGAQNKVWLMNGVARAAEARIMPDAASADWKIRGIDDFNGDGNSDLVFWNQGTGSVEFWLMNGTTRVDPPVPLGGAPPLDPSWELAGTADGGLDGLPDIIWRNALSQQIVIWAMEGTSHLRYSYSPTPDHAVDANWQLVSALDSNGDGHPDFLWYNVSSGKLVTWYMRFGVRQSGQFTTPSSAGDSNWKVVASGDFSGTSALATPPLGSPDIVWRNETSGNQVIWHMNFASTRVHGEFTNPTANSPALDWTIVGPR